LEARPSGEEWCILKVVESIKELPEEEVIAVIGVFDGVHLGHQELFKEALKKKEETGLPVLCLTFHPHPRVFLETTGRSKKEDYRLLSLPEEKEVLIAQTGADYYWAVPFTKGLSQMTPEEFARGILRQTLNVRHVVCGFNFTFGYMGKGRPADLLRTGKDLGFSVTVVSPYMVKGKVVSSTRVRCDLEEGRIEDVVSCLGRPYCVYGTVGHGDGRGKTVGIPTSNVQYPPGKLVPGNGVYAGIARRSGFAGDSKDRIQIIEELCAVNVGTRPTFGGSEIRLEVHIPGFSGELYGQKIQVFFLKRLRDEKRFESPEALRVQVEKDISEIFRWSENVAPGSRASGIWDQGAIALMRAYDRILDASLP